MLFPWICCKYFGLFKKCPHRSFKKYFCVKIKHNCHSLHFWINFNLFDSHLIIKPIEKWCFVDVCIQNQFVGCSFKEFFALICCTQMPSPKSSFQIQSWILFQSHECFTFDFQTCIDLINNWPQSKLFD